MVGVDMMQSRTSETFIGATGCPPMYQLAFTNPWNHGRWRPKCFAWHRTTRRTGMIWRTSQIGATDAFSRWRIRIVRVLFVIAGATQFREMKQNGRLSDRHIIFRFRSIRAPNESSF